MRNASQLGCAVATMLFVGLLLWTQILTVGVRLDEPAIYTAIGLAIVAFFGVGLTGMAAQSIARWWSKRRG